MPMANDPGLAKRLAITTPWYLVHARLAKRMSEASFFLFPLDFKNEATASKNEPEALKAPSMMSRQTLSGRSISLAACVR